MVDRYPIPQMVDPVEDHTTHNIVYVATGKKGSAPDELNRPCAVAIDETTHQIFVTNRSIREWRYSRRRESSLISWV